jgi:hypothetical protein
VGTCWGKGGCELDFGSFLVGLRCTDSVGGVLQEMTKKIQEAAKMSRRLPKIQDSVAEAEVHFSVRIYS